MHLPPALTRVAAAQDAVSANVGAARAAATRAEELHAASRASCWHTFVVLVAVMLVFAWTAVLIRARPPVGRRVLTAPRAW